MLALLSLTGCLLPGCGHRLGGGTAAQGKVLRVAFPGLTGARLSGPEGWADRRGLLLPAIRPLGFTGVQWIPLPNGPDVNEALASRAADIGILGDAPAVVGRAAGIPTQLITVGSVGGNVWLIGRADGPRTVEQLAGKTVAAPKGSNMARYLVGLLEEKGLTKRVTFVHLLPSDSEAALQRGDIAAYASPYGPLLVSHGYRVIDEAKNHPHLTGTGVTIATESFLAANPAFPAVWNRVRAAGIADLKAHQDDYYQAQAVQARLPAAVYRSLYPVSVYAADPFTPKGLTLLTGTKDFLNRQHLLKADFSIDHWIKQGPEQTAKQ